MEETGAQKKWVYCPICDGKTRVMVNEDTILYLFPLYCPRCKKETIISVVKYAIKVHAGTKN